MPKDFPDNTRLGLVGHFRLTEQQKQIVKESGLLIRHEGMFERAYRVSPLFNNVSMNTIIPEFIHSTPMPDGSRRMTCAEVGKLMTFLHQPLRGGIAIAGQNEINDFAREKTTDIVEGFGGNPQDVPRIFMDGVVTEIKNHERKIKAQATPDLLLAQKILNFTTTGSTLITKSNEDADKKEKEKKKEAAAPSQEAQAEQKKFHHQDIKVTDDDEHVGIQEEITAQIKLKTAMEMGGRFIKGAEYNPMRGMFTIPVSQSVQDQNFTGAEQNKLAANIKAAIAEIAPTQAGRPIIHLTSDEITALIAVIHRDHKNLAENVENVAHEEHIQFALSEIAKRTEALDKDELFARISAARGPEDRSAHLDNILKSTSALTALLKSPVLNEAWKRYYYTERKDAPISDMLKETAVFQAVAQHYIERGNITAAELEAISHEFSRF